MGLAASLAAHAGSLELDAALSAEPGRPVALIGANAAGKTTLLRCLAGLHRPDRGRIEVDGEVWFDSERRIDRPPHRRAAGVVPQQGVLFPHLDVEANVAYGLRAARVPRQEARRRTHDALARHGLAALRTRDTRTLSGGERQRVALARATVLEPALLLLSSRSTPSTPPPAPRSAPTCASCSASGAPPPSWSPTTPATRWSWPPTPWCWRAAASSRRARPPSWPSAPAPPRWRR